jgi:hypothetical protein
MALSLYIYVHTHNSVRGGQWKNSKYEHFDFDYHCELIYSLGLWIFSMGKNVLNLV